MEVSEPLVKQDKQIQVFIKGKRKGANKIMHKNIKNLKKTR